jgi:hypothetical protein
MQLVNLMKADSVRRLFRRDPVMAELGGNAIGPARYVLNRVAYELGIRQEYYMAQTTTRFTGPSQQAMVMGQLVTLASVSIKAQSVAAIIYGTLPAGAQNGEMFRVGVIGSVGDGPASFYEKQTGVRPAIGLEAVQKPGGFANPGAPTLVRGRGDLRFSPVPTVVFRTAETYNPAAPVEDSRNC